MWIEVAPLTLEAFNPSTDEFHRIRISFDKWFHVVVISGSSAAGAKKRAGEDFLATRHYKRLDSRESRWIVTVSLCYRGFLVTKAVVQQVQKAKLRLLFSPSSHCRKKSSTGSCRLRHNCTLAWLAGPERLLCRFLPLLLPLSSITESFYKDKRDWDENSVHRLHQSGVSMIADITLPHYHKYRTNRSTEARLWNPQSKSIQYKRAWMSCVVHAPRM